MFYPDCQQRLKVQYRNKRYNVLSFLPILKHKLCFFGGKPQLIKRLSKLQHPRITTVCKSNYSDTDYLILKSNDLPSECHKEFQNIRNVHIWVILFKTNIHQLYENPPSCIFFKISYVEFLFLYFPVHTLHRFFHSLYFFNSKQQHLLMGTEITCFPCYYKGSALILFL